MCCNNTFVVLCALCCCLLCCGCAYSVDVSDASSTLSDVPGVFAKQLHHTLGNGHSNNNANPNTYNAYYKRQEEDHDHDHDHENSTIAVLLEEILDFVDTNNDSVIDDHEFDELYAYVLPVLAEEYEHDHDHEHEEDGHDHEEDGHDHEEEGHEHEDEETHRRLSQAAIKRRAVIGRKLRYKLRALGKTTGHFTTHKTATLHTARTLKIDSNTDASSRKRADEEHCPPPDDVFLFADANNDEVLEDDEILDALLRMVIMILDGCNVEEEAEEECDERPEEWEAYLAALGSVSMVCFFSLVGVMILPCLDSERTIGISAFIMMLMISFASGALLGDAIFHIIPEVFEANEAAGDVEKDHLKTLSVLIVGILVFFLIEKSLVLIVGHAHSHSGAGEAKHEDKPGGDSSEEGESSETDMEEGEKSDDEKKSLQETFVGYFSKRRDKITTSFTQMRELGDGNLAKGSMKAAGAYGKEEIRRVRFAKSYGWLNLTADAFHNFIDGLAIGVAYSQSISLGVSTTLAVVFHEIPQELGDYALIVKAGFGKCFALCFNFFSALTAFCGCFIGLGVGQSAEDADRWILSFTAGGFIYIALANMFPELNDYLKKRSWWGLFALCTEVFGFLVGLVVLLVLALEEEHESACTGGEHDHSH